MGLNIHLILHQVHSVLPPLLLSLALTNLLSCLACVAFMLLLSCSTHNLTFRWVKCSTLVSLTSPLSCRHWRDSRKGREEASSPMLPRAIL